ncbi:MAG TPA: LEA type 2 family protein [Piscinibacter sp.]|uniref:LEA type 2 family protein n=1 Tax=Piscinibacter sp. TaxID=1903157 RepID=UPI0011DAF9E6|nr:LEA type 2 family protein [Piscinibacter sp.]TXH61470.1 MAG: water stress/hypersensitive response domain-containing protein [Burkholderiaceae bacterium]MBP5989899.1 LEA type 2 family protein [Piscinibacter sp.]MBP6026716.1 LEA type 2 family protein [Piscinibacter sp.]HNJ83353.1 LEA type 2 family protein [Piscinibacter sp.]HNK18179.1 LEA type 2 family protein [Piscinibacter sp.]
MRWPTLLLAALVSLLLAACAALPGRDPLRVELVGIEPIEGQGLELRLAVKLRVQNPNEEAVEYDGAALDLEVNGKSLAYGVSDQRGSVPRYGERVLVVPVSITALNVVRQALALADGTQRESVPFVLRGKLAGGVFGAVRFSQEGSIGIASLLPRAAR